MKRSINMILSTIFIFSVATCCTAEDTQSKNPAPPMGVKPVPGGINGTVVEILDPSPTYDEESNYNWLHIRFINEDGDSQDGWVVAKLLLVATPQPDW